MGSRVRVPPRSPIKSSTTHISGVGDAAYLRVWDAVGTHFCESLPITFAHWPAPTIDLRYFTILMTEDRFQYQTCRWSAGQPDQAKRWFDELELTGPQNVRARLAQSDAGSVGAIAIGAGQMMTIGFAQEWLAWH